LTKWQAHLNGTEIPGCENYNSDEAIIKMYDNSIVCD